MNKFSKADVERIIQEENWSMNDTWPEGEVDKTTEIANKSGMSKWDVINVAHEIFFNNYLDK